eukprot:157855_1
MAGANHLNVNKRTCVKRSKALTRRSDNRRCHYRGFQVKYDSSTSTLLDQLEQTECDRAQMVHRILKLYLEIEQVMVQQTLRNINTILEHIAYIDAHSDNMVFVEKQRSNQKN